MKRFADSLVRQKGIKPPPGYKTSISICRKFLNEHAPKKAEGETAGKPEPKPVSPAQLLYAKKIAQGKGLVIPDEAKASSAAMSAWIDVEPRQQAPQARSQDCLQAGWFRLHLNRGGRQRGLGNAKLAPMPLSRLPPSHIR